MRSHPSMRDGSVVKHVRQDLIFFRIVTDRGVEPGGYRILNRAIVRTCGSDVGWVWARQSCLVWTPSRDTVYTTGDIVIIRDDEQDLAPISRGCRARSAPEDRCHSVVTFCLIFDMRRLHHVL